MHTPLDNIFDEKVCKILRVRLYFLQSYGLKTNCIQYNVTPNSVCAISQNRTFCLKALNKVYSRSIGNEFGTMINHTHTVIFKQYQGNQISGDGSDARQYGTCYSCFWQCFDTVGFCTVILSKTMFLPTSFDSHLSEIVLSPVLKYLLG